MERLGHWFPCAREHGQERAAVGYEREPVAPCRPYGPADFLPMWGVHIKIRGRCERIRWGRADYLYRVRPPDGKMGAEGVFAAPRPCDESGKRDLCIDERLEPWQWIVRFACGGADCADLAPYDEPAPFCICAVESRLYHARQPNRSPLRLHPDFVCVLGDYARLICDGGKAPHDLHRLCGMVHESDHLRVGLLFYTAHAHEIAFMQAILHRVRHLDSHYRVVHEKVQAVAAKRVDPSLKKECGHGGKKDGQHAHILPYWRIWEPSRLRTPKGTLIANAYCAIIRTLEMLWGKESQCYD